MNQSPQHKHASTEAHSPLNSAQACSHDGLISLDEALASYTTVTPLPVLSLPLIQAHQHVLAEDVLSPVALPLFNQSAVDGYALRQADIDTGIRKFELVGEIRAGIVEQLEIGPGQALRIFTGGRLPASADTVARQEIVQREQHHIHLQQFIGAGTDIRYQGEELAKHSKLASQGQYLNSGLLAALSMAGVQQLKVYRQPRIAIVITGDEVKKNPYHITTTSQPTNASAAYEDPASYQALAQMAQLDNAAQIFDANGPLISTWLKQQGYSKFELMYVSDDHMALQQVLKRAFHQFDLVVTTGGVSVGDYDLIRPVSMQLGARQIFWQVAQKPGKPLYFAHFENPATGQHSYLMGLPGNPAAVIIGLQLHVRTLLNCLQVKAFSLPQWQTGLFSEDLRPDSRERLLRMQMSVSNQGQIILSLLPRQHSHMISNMAQANVLVRVPANQQFAAPAYLNFIIIH